MRTPQDFFGKKQTQYCKSRVYEHEFFQCFYRTHQKYLVILNQQEGHFSEHFFDRKAIFMQGLKGPIHTSATMGN